MLTKPLLLISENILFIVCCRAHVFCISTLTNILRADRMWELLTSGRSKGYPWCMHPTNQIFSTLDPPLLAAS